MAASKPSMNMSNTNGAGRSKMFRMSSQSDEEVDTDKLAPKKDEFNYERADEAMPDLTTSGDNVHMGAAVADAPMLTDEEREKLEAELKQVENDVSVLQDVLHNKLERLQTIRRTLGLETNQNVFRNSIYRLRDSGAYQKTSEKIYEWKDGVQQSEAYQKTGEALKTAGEKTKETLTTVGATMSKKLGDMRNSNTFKSFEERMGSAYTSVKRSQSFRSVFHQRRPQTGTVHTPPVYRGDATDSSKMSGSRSEDDLGNVQLPEQKVPM